MNALEMALEALTNPSTIAVSHAIELIKKELAKPERWFQQFGDAPPRKEWVGLTDDEIHKIVDDRTPTDARQEELNDFVLAIRAAELRLKEKNGG
jgi:hypothetical protein